jgi:putative ABC transport system ATP-binding protein
MVQQSTTSHLIVLDHISKHFRVGDHDVTILKDISLEVSQGEFVAIVGPSGSGKSTLINMINGIDRPSMGEIKVADQSLNCLSENQLAKWRGTNTGIVFQFFQLLPALSLLQNITLSMDFVGKYASRERTDRAKELLEMVGLVDQADKLPGMVSGGQQQRAAIARALANDPPLIVADEPTGNLDSQSADVIFDLFAQLVNQGKTILVVTHDRERAHQMWRVIEIRDGRIESDRS